LIDRSTYFKKYYSENREKYKAVAKASYYRRRDDILTKYNSDEHREYQRDYMKKLRERLINSLGSECVRCGNTDIRCLQVDHIDGGGTKDYRSRITYNGSVFYAIHPEKIDNKLQVLCANCNWIKRYERNETALGRRKKKIENL
jgi:hypothetical protein